MVNKEMRKFFDYAISDAENMSESTLGEVSMKLSGFVGENGGSLLGPLTSVKGIGGLIPLYMLVRFKDGNEWGKEQSLKWLRAAGIRGVEKTCREGKIEEIYISVLIKKKKGEPGPGKKMFMGMNWLEEITLINMKMWESESFEWMFAGCSNLREVKTLGWGWGKTAKCKNMSCMFRDCKKLQAIDKLWVLETYYVKDMSYMFSGCSSLKSVKGIETWNTNNLRTVRSMLEGCKMLNSVPNLSRWNTGNLRNVERMFYGCESVVEIPGIEKWETKNLERALEMIGGCTSLLFVPDMRYWSKEMLGVLNAPILERCGYKNPSWGLLVTAEGLRMTDGCINICYEEKFKVIGGLENVELRERVGRGKLGKMCGFDLYEMYRDRGSE